MSYPHKYRPLLRPVTTYTLPQGVRWDFISKPASYPINRPDLPQSEHPYGEIALERPLSADEKQRFGMLPI